MDKNQLRYYVAKSNEIIRTKQTLTKQQFDCLSFLLSKIQADDDPETWYEFSLSEMCDAMNITQDARGVYYKLLTKDMEELTKRTAVFTNDGHIRTVSYIGDFDIMPLNDSVRVTINPNVQEYFFGLVERGNYTQYKLADTLVYNSFHAARLYEILLSYANKQKDYLEIGGEVKVPFSIERLRFILDVEEQYKTFYDLKRYVIQRCVDEVNKCADDIHVEFEAVSKKNKIAQINFIVTAARAKQIMTAHETMANRLNYSKATQSEVKKEGEKK